VAWDPTQYARFSDERSRPAFDLLARVPDIDASLVLDLGCGTGELTGALAERWPEARVIGVDSSAEMLAKARAPRVEFVRADLAEWRPPSPAGLVFTNAAIQWVPDHERLLAHLVAMLAPKGVLAVQMPGNFAAPSHVALREAANAHGVEGWREAPVMEPDWYVRRLWALACAADAWETTYLHVLAGEDAVLEWIRGTAMRPVLERVPSGARAAFEADVRERLRKAYPRSPDGTLFPFRRLFFVATKR
jgi:trans-aconitate 2-methyltransferase